MYGQLDGHGWTRWTEVVRSWVMVDDAMVGEYVSMVRLNFLKHI